MHELKLFLELTCSRVCVCVCVCVCICVYLGAKPTWLILLNVFQVSIICISLFLSTLNIMDNLAS